MQERSKREVMLVWIFLLSLSFVSSQLLNKAKCGDTASCFSKPASCTSSDDCEYLLKYSVTEDDYIVFELSTNKFQWISVGFNSKPQMIGGRALACEKHGSSIVLHHYNLPQKLRPTASAETNATLVSGAIKKNVLYCKIRRKLYLGKDRYNLRNPVYLLRAAGEIENGLLKEHDFYSSSVDFANVSTIFDNSDHSKARKRIDTSLCGKTMGCSRVPSGCHDNTDCKYLVTFSKSGNNVEFSVSGKADGWIAVGFNDKPKMGGTDAVICQQSQGEVKLWVADLEYDSPDLLAPGETILLDGKYEGGIIYCKFTRPRRPKKRSSIDVSKFIIYGTGSGNTKLNKHEDEDRQCSKVKVDFGSTSFYDLGECGASSLSKVHGSFMIFAWMFLAVISIFIARYSRSLWKNWKILGSHAWFQFHRVIMGIAVIMTIIAIIIIFVDKEGWSESAGDHAIFGIIVLVLAIIQPTIAFFRPDPTERRRPIFNWIHRIVALILIIMAVVAVFKGTELLEDSGGETSYKVLIALIVIVILTALVLEFLAFRLRTKLFVNCSANDSMQEEKPNLFESYWESKVQRGLLVVFSLIVFILAVVMIAYVGGAGSHDDHHDDDDDD